MIKNLYIYGSGSLGREVYNLAKLLDVYNNIFLVEDDGLNQLKSENDLLISFSKLYNHLDKDKKSTGEFVIAVGEPSLRKKLYEKIDNLKSFIPATLIHPSAFIADNAVIEAGTIINYGSFVSDRVQIFGNAYLQPYSVIGHDSKIGNSSVVSSFVSLGGNCKIGSEVFIGMNASLIQGISVGDHSIVGMGAVVTRSVNSEMIVAGNPAREIGRNESRSVFGNKN
jgi:sugar O-acyltransferase (sialic acid O-acetyltransferase NeuD family)